MTVGVAFEVPGNPVAKGRPRVVRVGGFTRTHTPQPTIDFENRVRICAHQAGVRPVDGPVRLAVFAYFALPKSRHLKREPRTQEWKTTKPDLDNVVKAVKDALNSVAYADDSQVVRLIAEKYTAAQGEPARTIVEVGEMP